MANDDVSKLTQKRAADVLLEDEDRNSVGVVRILAQAAGQPGSVREYETGDEALVEAGQAEWVVAPVHSPQAGRRLDHDAEREALPREGIEVFPPAADGNVDREAEARIKGYVEAHSDDGVGEKIAGKRVELAKANRDRTIDDADDVRTQAALGGMAARSGPVTVANDLTPAKLAPSDSAAAPDADTRTPAEKEQASQTGAAKKAAPAKSTGSRES